MNFSRRMQEQAETAAMCADEALLLSVLAPCNPVRRGSRWILHCPVHADKNPSADANRCKDGMWRWGCHSCGAHGNVIDLVMRLESCGFREARRRLGAREVGPPPPPPKGPQRAGEPAPTLVLACERPGCTSLRDVTMLEVMLMVDRCEVTTDHRWVCLRCRIAYRRHRRYLGLYRLLAPVDRLPSSNPAHVKPLSSPAITPERGQTSCEEPKGWSGPEVAPSPLPRLDKHQKCTVVAQPDASQFGNGRW